MEGIPELTLRELAQELSYEWEPLASFLGLKVVEISVLKMDFPNHTENRVFNMLIRWRQKQEPTVDQLAMLSAALKRVNRMDLAFKLEGPPTSDTGSKPQGAVRQNGQLEVPALPEKGPPKLYSTSQQQGTPRQTVPHTNNSPSDHNSTGSKPPSAEDCSGRQEVYATSAKGTESFPANTANTEPHKDEEHRQTQGPSSSCSKHEGQTVQCMCVTCQEVVCSQCADTDHCRPQHHCISCETACEKYRLLLANRIPALDEQVKEIRDFLEESSRVKTDFQNKVSVTVKEVQERAAQVIAGVKAEENRLIEEVRKLERDRGKTFQDQEKRATVLLGTRQHALETASDVAKVGPDPEFLSQYLMVSPVIDMMNNQHCPKADPRLSFLHFTPTSAADDVGISLGRLELGGKWVMRCEFGSKGSGPGEFQLAKGIAARQAGEIEVADYVNKRVVVFSIEGEVLKTIPTQGVPRDIAALRTHLAVVDDANHVQLYSRYNMAPSVVGKSFTRRCDFRSVAFKTDGTVVVGDVGKSALTEHARSDGALKRTISLKIKPYFIAVDAGAAPQRERVVISSGFQREVHVMDSYNEAVLAVIRPTIEGQPVFQCTGVCCNSQGIFVAVSGGDERDQGHVHQYEADGAFRACVAQGLHGPQGIAFTADGHQLAVADTYSVKIYHKV